MNISPNSLITLEYDPTKDILMVALPDIRQFTINEVEHALQLVVEAVMDYDIKKMFLDSSKAVIEVEDEEYRKVVMKFGQDLTKTRLRKLARLGSAHMAQEQRASAVAEEVKSALMMPLDFRSFDSKEAALQWLEANNQT